MHGMKLTIHGTHKNKGVRNEGMLMLVNGRGIIETTFGSHSNNDILVYEGDNTNHAIFTNQNFTSYPKKLTVILEYTKLV